MRMWFTVALLACVGLGCSDERELSPADYAGDWALVSEANSSCFGAAGAASRQFTVTDPARGYADGVFNVVTGWDFVRPFRYGWTVTGNFNLGNRTVELNFWQSTGSVGAVFTGEILGDGTIQGELRDPKPGHRPHLVIGSCTFTARLERAP